MLSQLMVIAAALGSWFQLMQVGLLVQIVTINIATIKGLGHQLGPIGAPTSASWRVGAVGFWGPNWYQLIVLSNPRCAKASSAESFSFQHAAAR